jgi:hypothetical protein
MWHMKQLWNIDNKPNISIVAIAVVTSRIIITSTPPVRRNYQTLIRVVPISLCESMYSYYGCDQESSTKAVLANGRSLEEQEEDSPVCFIQEKNEGEDENLMSGSKWSESDFPRTDPLTITITTNSAATATTTTATATNATTPTLHSSTTKCSARYQSTFTNKPSDDTAIPRPI